MDNRDIRPCFTKKLLGLIRQADMKNGIVCQDDRPFCTGLGGDFSKLQNAVIPCGDLIRKFERKCIHL